MALKVLHGTAVADGASGEIGVAQDGVHEVIGDANGVVGVLEEDGRVGFGVGRRTVVSGGDQGVRLGFFFLLALDEVNDVGMVDVEDDHLGGAACLAARLDDAGEGVKTFHEAERAAGGAAAAEVSVEERSGERLVPVPDPHLKSMPSVLARVRMESSESFTELMKQAEHCGLVYPVTPNSTRPRAGFQCQFWPSELGSMRSQPTLNHTGELKAAYWRMRMCDELVVESCAVFGSAEVALRQSPVANGFSDAGDELADAGFALGRADLCRADICWRRCWSRSWTSLSGPRHLSARR